MDSLIKEKDIIEDDEEKAILVGSDTRESLEELKELTKLVIFQYLIVFIKVEVK